MPQNLKMSSYQRRKVVLIDYTCCPVQNPLIAAEKSEKSEIRQYICLLTFPTNVQPPPLSVMSYLAQHPSALSSPPPPIPNDQESILSSSPDCAKTTPTTPIVKRIASLRLPHDQSEKELTELTPMLQIDLEGQIIDSVPDLFNVLFPDDAIPFKIDEVLLNSLSTFYDPTTYRWNLKNANTESVSKFFITEHLHCRNSLYTEILLILERFMHKDFSINRCTDKTEMDC
jgi:hypothetical protein